MILKEYGEREHYLAFIKHCEDNLKGLSDSLHSIFKDITEASQHLMSNISFNKAHNINYENLIKLEIKAIKINESRCSKIDIPMVKMYNEMVDDIREMESLIILIKRYNFMVRTPYHYYLRTLRTINFHICKALFTGRSVKLPMMGRLRIRRVPINIDFIDWGASIKFRDKLIAEGKIVRGGLNPDGEPWFLNNIEGFDWFSLTYWRKVGSQYPNRSYYNFEPGKFNNLSGRYEELLEKNTSVKDIIDMKGTGLFDKIIYLHKYHHNYTLENFKE